jgi:hypothetical protein
VDKNEAREILAGVISELRTRSREDLRALLGSPYTQEIAGPSGTTYQIEVQAFWDDKSELNLRVLGSIDDGGFSAFKPLTDDFIVAPDGSFVGE